MTERPSRHLHSKSIVSEKHPGRQLCLRAIVIVVVGQMSEISALRTDTSGGGERFIQAHVGGMRIAPKGIKHRHLHTLNLLNRLRWNFFAIVQISQQLASFLCEKIADCSHRSMR